MSAWYLAPLDEVTANDRDLAGGKGANLGELMRSGFAVPDGFVVSTRFYCDALRLAKVGGAAGGTATSESDPAQLRAAIQAMTIPSDMASLIRDACAVLGQGPVAVRSSATAEDLPGAAFAGQQETFLHVIGSESVLQAVRGCWASLWADRAVSYRTRLGYVEEPEIAVVVQRMVAAEFAGVMFTANPVTGARDEIVIEASPGLGEAVVAGLVTPEHVVVDRRLGIRERRPGRREVIIRGSSSGGVIHEEPGVSGQRDLAAEVLTELAAVGRRIGERFGRPQDIEWAYADGSIWVVQARPLTVLPPPPVKANRVQRAAGAVTSELIHTRPYPLDMTMWTIPGWFSILARMFTDLPAFHLNVERMFPEAGGVVTQLLPPEIRPTWRTVTAPVRIRRRLRRFDPAQWTSDPRFIDYEHRLAKLTGKDLAAMSWHELLAVADGVMDTLNRLVDVRVDYLPAWAVSMVHLRIVLILAGASSLYWPLLSGAPTQTRAANDALDSIATQIRVNPAWREAFNVLGEGDLIAAVWRSDEFAPLRTGLQSWLASFGHRETTSAAILSGPTWEDDPQLLLSTLQGLVAGPTRENNDPDQRVTAEKWIRTHRGVRLTGLVGRASAAARVGIAFREDSHFHLLRVRPILQHVVQEAGVRLSTVGALTGPKEIFHLRRAELHAIADPTSLTPEQRSQLRSLIRGRSLTRAEFGQAPLISPATLYPGVRRPNPDALVTGTPGGGGRATGPVRVIREPGEFGQLHQGEVLVCPYTNPSWTPLFQRAAAVVADSGSFGSHAAIVAREYGIPAVMGTGNGTQALTDGQPVVVDGDRGAVIPART